MTLATYILAFFQATIPLNQHAFYEREDITLARYESIADTIATVAVENPLFANDESGVRTALILGSIATYESSLKADVDSCKTSGDNGQAWSVFQVHNKKEVLCERRVDAARIAREMIRASFKACKALPVMDRLSVYTDGSCHENWKRSGSRMHRATAYEKTHPFIKEIEP